MAETINNTTSSTEINSIVQNGVSYPIVDKTAREAIDTINNTLDDITSGSLNITVDDTLDTNSTNPVQNTVIASNFDNIYNAIDNIQSTIEDINTNTETYKTSLDSVLSVNTTYTLGIVTSDIDITLPTDVNNGDDVSVTLGYNDTVSNINVTNTNVKFDLKPATNTYYSITFIYDGGINNWVCSVLGIDIY